MAKARRASKPPPPRRPALGVQFPPPTNGVGAKREAHRCRPLAAQICGFFFPPHSGARRPTPRSARLPPIRLVSGENQACARERPRATRPALHATPSVAHVKRGECASVCSQIPRPARSRRDQPSTARGADAEARCDRTEREPVAAPASKPSTSGRRLIRTAFDRSSAPNSCLRRFRQREGWARRPL